MKYNSLWLLFHTGNQMLGDPESAPPSVYPNEDGWPMLPDVDELDMRMGEEKQIMRRWITCLSCESFQYAPLLMWFLLTHQMPWEVANQPTPQLKGK